MFLCFLDFSFKPSKVSCAMIIFFNLLSVGDSDTGTTLKEPYNY